jgi:DNA-binding transcriptional ArsR family regulator
MASPSVSADVFEAIASPARRALLAKLSNGEAPVSELAESFDMTLSAVSQHLTVLKGAGLVRMRRLGRQRLYRIDAAPLREVAEWVGKYERFWAEKLAALGEYLEEEDE